ncbi:hypothetical protein [Nocardia sp. XZ_19_385]|nr:hypothetical protein [Nocardia sp. XZ_19_385]
MVDGDDRLPEPVEARGVVGVGPEPDLLNQRFIAVRLTKQDASTP